MPEVSPLPGSLTCRHKRSQSSGHYSLPYHHRGVSHRMGASVPSVWGVSGGWGVGEETLLRYGGVAVVSHPCLLHCQDRPRPQAATAGDGPGDILSLKQKPW